MRKTRVWRCEKRKRHMLSTFKRLEGRKPPIHMKQRSAGVFQVPETRWKTSVLASMPLRLIIWVKWPKQFSTNIRSSLSAIRSCIADRSSLIRRRCSSTHLAYSISNVAASVSTHHQFLSLYDPLLFYFTKTYTQTYMLLYFEVYEGTHVYQLIK